MPFFPVLFVLVLCGCSEDNKNPLPSNQSSKLHRRYTDFATVLDTYYMEYLQVPNLDFAPVLEAAVRVVDDQLHGHPFSAKFFDRLGYLHGLVNSKLAKSSKSDPSRLAIDLLHFPVVCGLLSGSEELKSGLLRARAINVFDAFKPQSKDSKALVVDFFKLRGVCRDIIKTPSCFVDVVTIIQGQFAVEIYSSKKFDAVRGTYVNTRRHILDYHLETIQRDIPDIHEKFRAYFGLFVALARTLLKGDTNLSDRDLERLQIAYEQLPTIEKLKTYPEKPEYTCPHFR